MDEGWRMGIVVGRGRVRGGVDRGGVGGGGIERSVFSGGTETVARGTTQLTHL